MAETIPPTVMTTVYGWPMKRLETGRFKGELTVCCPSCSSTNIQLSAVYPVHGTGAGGRGRLGDNGGYSLARCLDCGVRKEY